MTDLKIGAAPAVPQPDTPARIRDAAQQFEALLIQQLLRGMHEDGGWLGTGGDAASECASSFAEQHLAQSMAEQGGLGLADLIARGLRKD
jgi:Rod binding domain-containing protein